MQRLNKLGTIAKAIVAFLFPVFAKLSQNLTLMSEHQHVDWASFGWWALGASLLAFLVWLVPNASASTGS